MGGVEIRFIYGQETIQHIVLPDIVEMQFTISGAAALIFICSIQSTRAGIVGGWFQKNKKIVFLLDLFAFLINLSLSYIFIGY